MIYYKVFAKNRDSSSQLTQGAMIPDLELAKRGGNSTEGAGLCGYTS